MWSDIGVNLLFLLLTVAFLFAIVILLARLLTFYELPCEFHFENTPSLFLLYTKGFATSLFRRQGDLAVRSPKEATDVDMLINKALGKSPSQNNNKNNKNGSPTVKIVCIDCRIDREVLSRYAEVCGYPADVPVDFVPPCYLECYFLPLLISLTVSDDFKLSPLGLIHVGQTITQHTNISHLLREPFDLECGVSAYRFTVRGIEVDIMMKVYDRREMCVWQGVATLLSRDSSVRTGGGTKAGRSKAQHDGDEAPLTVKTTLHVPADMGRQYARVSGDWNPHHLWPLSAKILGFRKPIAHGMWTLSRCLTWVKQAGKLNFEAPFHIEAQFKRPLYMPGMSEMSLLPALDKGKQSFHVRDKRTDEPHLVGTIYTNL